MDNFGKKKAAPLWRVDRAEPAAKKKKAFGDLLFFLAFFSFFLKSTIDYTALIKIRPEMLNSMLVAISITCSVLKILTQRYTVVRLVCTFVVCVLIGYSSLIGINYLFLLGFLLIIGMQDIKLSNIIKVGFFTSIVNISVHVSWYIVAYFTNRSSINFTYRTGNIPRHNFFMGHANTFTGTLIWTCVDFIFLNYKNLKVFHMIVIWLINIIFYIFTDTNTGIIVLTFVTVLIFIDKAGKSLFDRLLTFLAKYIYVFCAVFFPFMTVIYIRLNGTLKELWHMFDSFMTGRIWLGTYAYNEYGYTILGIKDMAPRVVYWENRWFDTLTIFDNYYIANFVSYGIIHSVAAALAFIILCGKMEAREKILIIAFSLYAIMDSEVTNLCICPVLLIIGKYIYPIERDPPDMQRSERRLSPKRDYSVDFGT